MPWEYSVDSTRDAILTQAYGVVTDDELRAGLAAVFTDPRVHPDFRVFADYSGATNILVTVDTMVFAAQNRLKILSSQARHAFFAPSTLAYGLARMFQYYAEYHSPMAGPVEVFRGRPEALAWLNEGVPPEKLLT